MTIYECTVEKRNGEVFKLENFKGKVLLIVNTATGCGFTPQYKSLEELYQKYHEKGLEILDFPCDQFGHQAPGSDDEIHNFCTAKYNTSFDQFKKVDVNGENAIQLFEILKEEQKIDEISGLKNKMAMKAVEKINKTMKKENDIKWNFTKFLVDKNGNVVKRLSPIEDPIKLENGILNLL